MAQPRKVVNVSATVYDAADRPVTVTAQHQGEAAVAATSSVRRPS